VFSLSFSLSFLLRVEKNQKNGEKKKKTNNLFRKKRRKERKEQKRVQVIDRPYLTCPFLLDKPLVRDSHVPIERENIKIISGVANYDRNLPMVFTNAMHEMSRCPLIIGKACPLFYLLTIIECFPVSLWYDVGLSLVLVVQKRASRIDEIFCRLLPSNYLTPKV